MFKSTGYQVIDEYLDREECQQFLQAIEQFRRKNPLPEIHRPGKDRPLRYRVITGEQIKRSLPQVWDLYCLQLNQLAEEVSGMQLEPLDNLQAGVNVNIMEPDRSTYRWHYDRSPVTAILYLNEVDGGETEFYPNYRILLGQGKRLGLQRWLDRTIHIPPIRRVFGQRVAVAPRSGRLLLMTGNRSWHSVRSHRGNGERIVIVLAYDQPGAEHAMAQALDPDLYSQVEHEFIDPNYGI